MSLSWVARYAPTRVMTTRGYQPVVRVVWHPPGHRQGPIVKNMGALELVTPVGSRWYGAMSGAINAELRMVVAGYPARFEEMNRWKRVPAKLVPPQVRPQTRLFGSRRTNRR